MTRRILVTGGSGFVGRHLVPLLRAGMAVGDSLVATGHGTSSEESVPLDLTDRTAVSAFVERTRPTHTVHLAAHASVHQSIGAPGDAWRVNVGGMINLAEALAAHAPDGMLLFASTSEVYGASFKAGTPLDEQAPLAPQNAYARSKAAAESALADVGAAIARIVTVRPFNHTGAGQDERFVAPAFAAQIARIEADQGEPVMQVGNLEARRDFLDVADVVRAYRLLLDAADRLPPRAVFNVASGQARSIADLLDTLRRQSRTAIETRTDPARLRPSDTPVAAGDARAIERAVGWRPKVAWEETLRTVLDDWRARVRA